MIQAPDWMELALRESKFGVSEIAGVETNPRIRIYQSATSYGQRADEIPWCSDFVCWCVEEADFRSTASAAARSWLEWGWSIKPWPYGAIVVLSRGSNRPGRDVIDAPGHVGFLVASPTPREILLLGGNQRNKVCVQPFRRDRILDVRWAA